MIDELLLKIGQQISAATKTVHIKPKLVYVSPSDYAEILENYRLYSAKGLPELEGVPIRPSAGIKDSEVQIVV